MNHYWTAEQQYAIVEKLISDGWTFKLYLTSPEMRGWWIHEDIRPHRCGNPQGFYYAATMAFDYCTDYELNDLDVPTRLELIYG